MAEAEHLGGCHCGAVRFKVTTDLAQLLECNCSHCSKKGFILNFQPEARFELVTGEDQLAEYRFNTHKIGHRFCKVCGVQPFGMGSAPDGSRMAAVNVRCLDGIEVAELSTTPWNGRDM